MLEFFYKTHCSLKLGLILMISSLIFPATQRLPTNNLNLSQLNDFPQLEIGDVILRQGLGVDSALISKVSHSQFSHIGMVAAVSPSIVVIHATTDDDPKHLNQVIVSSLFDFVSKSKRIAVKRYFLTEKQKREISLFLKSMLGKPFVINGEKDSLYCSTLISKALSPYIDTKKLEYSYLDLPVISGWYLFPEEFLQDKNSSLIYNLEN